MILMISDRDKAMAAMRREGAKYSAIARRFGVTQVSARDACMRAEKAARRSGDPLFASLSAAAQRVGGTGQSVARTYNALRIHGIESVEKLRSCSKYELLRVRNIGEAALAIIEEALRR